MAKESLLAAYENELCQREVLANCDRFYGSSGDVDAV
jgi:hypothetical protein